MKKLSILLLCWTIVQQVLGQVASPPTLIRHPLLFGVTTVIDQTLVGNAACATSFVVNNLGDAGDATPGDGVCATSGGVCTLRAAIQEANALSSCDNITISFSTNGTITLGSELPNGTTGSRTINGNGTSNTIIQANANENTANYRIFRVTGSTANWTLDNLTIRNGGVDGTAVDGGGLAVSSSGTLTVSNCIVEKCRGDSGGGIFALNATLNVSNTTIRNNRTFRNGGGIFSQSSRFTLTNSIITNNQNNSTSSNPYGAGIAALSNPIFTMIGTTVSNNTHTGTQSDLGGGMYITNNASGANMNITGCIITGNSTSPNSPGGEGGGIYFSGSYPLTLTNTVLSNNTATNRGGGIYLEVGSLLTLNNVTVSNNTAPSMSGGGVFQFFSGTLNLNNTLVANNTGGDYTRSGGTLNAQYSLIEDGLSLVNGTNTANRTGDPALNPDLTLTSGSLAASGGSNALIPSGITTDLAGNARIQQGTVDIGAYESAFVGNISPSITAGAVLSRQRGSAGTTSTIATVSDTETAAGSLTVAATTVPSGLMVTSIVNSDGNITATVRADCAATIGDNTVVLTVTDGGNLTATANLTVNVTANSAPTLTYNNASVNTGTAATVSPATGPSDNGSISTIALQSVSPTTAPATLTVDNVTGVVTVPNNVPAGVYTVTVRATDNCSSFTDATFTLTVQSADYTITTASNVLTITDMSGNGETLEISENGSNIRFNVLGRTYSIDGGAATPFTTPANVAFSGITSIIVNTANGNDIINVGGFSSNTLPSLSIDGGTGDDQVNFNGDITFATNANLDVDLQNDDSNPGTDQVSFTNNANLLLTGTGAALIKVSRNIVFSNGTASLETTDGNLTLEANQQATASTGNFIGVAVNGATVRVNGTGSLSVKGKSGDDSAINQFGVVVQNGGLISGGTSGTATIEGAVGAASTNGNIGVNVTGTNARITSLGGNVSVVGFGGSAGASSTCRGVAVTTNGTITAGGSGTVTVSGTGGAGSGNFNAGVYVAGTANTLITSSGGNVSVTGNGGGTGSGTNNYGLWMESGGTITAGNSGTVTVQGTGGATTGNNNYGIYVDDANTQITSGGGNVSVTGQGGGASSSQSNIGVFVQSAAKITAGGTGTVNVNGTGGQSSGGRNYGVFLSNNNAQITSSGGDVSVTGQAGGTTAGEANTGVYLTSNSLVSAGGTGDLTVNGTGAATSGNYNFGVYLISSAVNTNNGNLNIVAQGGGSGSSIANYGLVLYGGTQVVAGGSGHVNIQANGGTSTMGSSNYGARIDDPGTLISSSGGDVTINAVGGAGSGSGNFGLSAAFGCKISAGGSGTVSITGQGGAGAGGSSNFGIRIEGTGTQITSSGGNVILTGIEGSGSNSIGISYTSSAAITTATNGGNITLIANSMDLASTISTRAAGSTTLRPYTNNIAINLGTATNSVGSPLGLSDTELDNITTGTLIIGNANSGNLTVSAEITRPASTNVQLISGGDINVSGGGFNTGGGTLLLDPGSALAAIKPTFNGTDVTASTLSLGGDLNIAINGTTAGDGTGSTYSQLKAVGVVNLAGVNLVLSGTPTLVGGETLILVDNDGTEPISGTFSNFAQGTTLTDFLGSGRNATISYTGGTDNNDVVISVINNVLCYADTDGDGFGDPNNSRAFSGSCGTGYVTDNTDCNDNSALEKPGQVWYKDSDNDGYAQTGAATITQCLRPAGYKLVTELQATSGDCNDNNAAIKPGATEICDGIDNNCNGSTDEITLASSPGNVNITWTGAIDTDWSKPCNWNPAWVPDASNAGVVINTTANQPAISGVVPTVNVIYVNTGATLTVNSGGQLTVSSTEDAKIGLTAASLINNGTIHLSNGSVGISASGGTSTVTNSGIININCSFGIQSGGASVVLNVLNNSSGVINTNLRAASTSTLNVTNNGVLNYASTGFAVNFNGLSSLINNGTFNITLGLGITNPAGSSITNDACGKILLSAGNYSNAGTTTNGGLIQLSNTLSNTGTFTNNGTLKYGSLTGTVTSNQNSSIVVNNSIPIFTYGGVYNGAGASTVNGIYKEQAATNPAGVFTAPNTFEPDASLPLGTQTLYAKITPSGASCSYVVPFSYNNCSASASISYAGTPFCKTLTTGAVTLMGTSGGTFSSTSGLSIDASTGSINPSASIAGNYVVTYSIPASGGCGAVSTTANVTVLPAITFTAPTVTQPSCSTPTGTIVVNATPSSSLEYSIDNGNTWQSSATFSNLAAGNYRLKARFQALTSCEATYSSNPVTLTSPFTASTTTDTWTGCVSTDWATAGNWQDGSVPTTSDDVMIPNTTNKPVIIAGTAAVAKTVEVASSARLTINASGSLTINGSKVDSAPFTSALIVRGGTLVNDGLLVLGNSSSVGDDAVLNYGTFTNTGEIRIDRFSRVGFYNIGLNSVNNSGKILIGASAPAGSLGLASEGTFTNQSGGEINISQTTSTALSSYGAFTNNGKIILGANGAVGSRGIDFTPSTNLTFSNNSGGEIIIDGTTQTAISVSTGTFINSSKIILGATGSIGFNGISNSGTFNNNAGGELSIDRSTSSGIFNNGTITNNAKITIGTNAGVSSMGVDNQGNLTNSACATLIVAAPINNSNTLTNSGYFKVTTSASHTNGSAGLVNNGIIEYPIGNPIPNVVNNGIIAAPFSGCSPALQIGSSNVLGIGTTWYQEASLTTPSGTYQSASNTFSSTRSFPGTYVNYFSVNDAANGCSYVVSVSHTLSAPPTITTSPSPAICAGATSFTIPYSAPSGTPTTYSISGVGITTVSNAPLTATPIVVNLSEPASGSLINYTLTVSSSSSGCTSNIITGSVTVNPPPSASISYGGTPYCKSVTSALVTLTGSGGTFSSTSGLSIDVNTGTINPSTSTAGTYTVTYTIPASGGCSAVTATTNVVITDAPSASISYSGTPYCKSVTSALVTLTGSGGTFSSTTGLSIDANTGTINPSTSTAGTYTVTYTIPPLGGCSAVTAMTNVVITDVPSATISYGGTPYCKSVTSALVTLTGSGGTFSSTSGLSIDANTGTINPSTSTAGTYTVTYTIGASGGCSAVTATTNVVITEAPSASISYGGTPYCKSVTSAAVTLTGSGGTFSSTSGLSIDANTGTINPSTSTAGTYTVTYTIGASGGCSAVTATTNVVITDAPSSSISYSGTPYCKSVTSALVTLTGSGGTFSSTSGLTIDANTGIINPSASTAGTYTVTYTIPASGGCSAVTATANVVITDIPSATISYGGTPYCKSVTSALVTLTGSGGTFSSTSGLSIDANTGTINPSTSTAGTYTVTYTIGASGGCSAVTATTNVVITDAPSASISYGGTPYCKSVTSAAVTLTGSGGGTFSSTSGLSIDANTGTINPSTSTAGTYTVTYTIPASGGCSAVTATTNVVITDAPSASISYGGTPYCKSVTSALVTLAGSGGTFSSTSGLTIDANTGTINPSTSTAGTYTVTYTIPASGGCSAVSATTNVVITDAPSASISYGGTPYCKSVTSAAVTLMGSGGTFSSTTGLTIDGNTGTINPSTSTAGTYTVTYTIGASGGCSAVTATANVVITDAPSASISYGGTPYCKSVTSALVTLTGSGGTFSSTSGLSIDANTGTINPSTSTAGTYTVTYIIPASGGCSAVSATTNVVITDAPSASISYGGTPYCKSVTSAAVTLTGSGGGTFSSTSGLSIDANTGTINPSTSTAGTYTVTYTIPASGGCSVVTATTNVVIQDKPTITLLALQQTLNEGNNPVLCDTDANPVNSLQFGVSGLCVSGSPVWRVQVGSGAWSNWSATAPVSQPSNNQLHRYQAACDANCASTYSGVIELTINNRASVPQNVSLMVDGVTVAVGETKEVCSLANMPLSVTANCAAGEIILYSVDGGEYSAGVPVGLVDNQFHNYRVRCRKSDGTPSCVESESGVMRLKLVVIPSAPTVSLSSTSSCNASASFSGQSTCGSLRTVWYNATTNVALPSLPSTVPSQTTSYYARCQTENGCVSEKSNVVTFTLTPTQVAPVITASQEIVCTGITVTISANCPAGSQTFWNTGVTAPSFEVAFNNVTKQTYWAKCLFEGGCQSAESMKKDIYWNAFVVTLINIGESKSSVKPANDKSLWSSQFITRDGGPELEQSTQVNPTLYYVENANKLAPRYWTVNVEACGLSTDGSLTFDMLATPEMGVIRSFNTHENNAPYFMYANREGWTELYGQNHPAYGFYQDNGVGGNVYDTGLPKGLYKLSIRYWDQKGWGSIYPSTRKPQGNVLAYQEYWFRIQSKDGVGVGAARTADSEDAKSKWQGSDNGKQITDNGVFATVLPNPVTNILRLKVQDSKGQVVQTSLTDASGREVLRRQFLPETNTHQEEFGVGELPSGVYFLRVQTENKQEILKVLKVN